MGHVPWITTNVTGNEMKPICPFWQTPFGKTNFCSNDRKKLLISKYMYGSKAETTKMFKKNYRLMPKKGGENLKSKNWYRNVSVFFVRCDQSHFHLRCSHPTIAQLAERETVEA